MNNEWTIDLTNQKQLRDHYQQAGQTEIAKSIEHTSSPHEGKTILLLTAQELSLTQKNNPDEILISIFGEEVPAKDCDDETRFGYVAYGRIV